MGFTSETARIAGKKSKRPKELGNDELRTELLEFSKELIEDLRNRNLGVEQKLRLVQITLGYCMPKLKIQEVATTIGTNEDFKISDLYKLTPEEVSVINEGLEAKY